MYLDQFEGNHDIVRDPLGTEHIRKLPLAYETSVRSEEWYL